MKYSFNPHLEGLGEVSQVYNTLRQGGDPLLHLFPWLHDLAGRGLGLSSPATNHPTVVGVKPVVLRRAPDTFPYFFLLANVLWGFLVWLCCILRLSSQLYCNTVAWLGPREERGFLFRTEGDAMTKNKRKALGTKIVCDHQNLVSRVATKEMLRCSAIVLGEVQNKTVEKSVNRQSTILLFLLK